MRQTLHSLLILALLGLGTANFHAPLVCPVDVEEVAHA